MKALNIQASPSSSPSDFDFFVGEWHVENRKLNERLAGCDEWTNFTSRCECRKILNGFANSDSFFATVNGVPFEGYTLRLFDPKTRLWSIYWADSVNVRLDVAQVGSFDNGVGEFFARDMFDGRDIVVKFRWDATDKDAPVWSQAFSADDGETWEWNWYMYFNRIGNR